MNQFKIDKLLSNCERVKDHSAKFDNEWSRFLIENCDQLVELSKYIESVAYKYTFEQAPINGFISSLKIFTTYTNLLVEQIEKHDKIDLNLTKIFKLVIAYAQRIRTEQQRLVNEEAEKENKRSLIINEDLLATKGFYDQIHSNEDVLPISLALYPGFWLGKEIQRAFKFFNFLFALAFKLPHSASSIYSSKSLGKYCFNAFKNATVKYPFVVWHQSECFFVSKFANYCLNLPVPVKSSSLYIERQKRFRLTHTGAIIDFHTATVDELNAYLNDEEEQERQSSAGLRHRNRDTVKCRYSYINKREAIRESVERIEKSKNEKDDQIFKVSKCHTARKTVTEKRQLSSTHSDSNQVKELNLYDCPSIDEAVERQLFFKTNKKRRNPKYDGPTLGDEFNKDRTVIIYLHGGGFFTQSPRSSEIWLRRAVNQLGGVPVLAVHYSLTVPFPVPTQEILDVYLWLFSGRDAVKDLIGFHPLKVVLSGDSAGGYFCLVNCILLNELNKKIDPNQATIPLPTAVVLEYPVASLCSMSPGKSLSTLEPLIAFHPLMLVISLYGANRASNGDYKKTKNENFLKIQEKNRHLFDLPEYQANIEEYKEFIDDDNVPWYQCDYPTFKSRAEFIETFYSNPFIKPFAYQHFDQLAAIDMYSLSGEFDFLIDDSIELMHLWKGNRCLDFIENAMHGFLYFEKLSAPSREALSLTIKRLQEASVF